jgi:chaperone BCS1
MQMCEKTSGSFMWNGSQWKSINSKFTKKFDQIYLPDDKVSFIKKTLKTFIDHKQYFVENGIPYKLSFLFEGNPGTGKTSVIKAIANELKYYVFIINAEKISYISDLIHEMKKRTPDNGNVIIVFEDIHKLQPETYNQIYGFLDGIYDITNCVIIMTTNIPHKKLDPTLVRAGRVNHIIKFDYLTEELMLKMFNNILPNCSGLVDKFINKIKHIKITPAVLESYLVKYRFAENEENKYGATIFNIQELIDTANTEADAYSNFDDSSSDSFYI